MWELPCVGDVRQLGFMVGIELVRDRNSRQPFPVGRRMGQRVVLQARRRGVPAEAPRRHHCPDAPAVDHPAPIENAGGGYLQ